MNSKFNHLIKILIWTATFKKEHGRENPAATINSQYFCFNNTKEMESAVFLISEIVLCLYSSFLGCLLLFYN